MSNINAYLNSLENLSGGLETEINSIINKNAGKILRELKLRLFNKGIDGDGNSLGGYHPSTKAQKKHEGKRSSHVTLRDTGSWYASLFLTYSNGELTVNSLNEKTPLLIEQYGSAILDLTIQEQELIIFGIIEPAVQKYINSTLPTEIDFS